LQALGIAPVTLATGAIADITIVDPEARVEVNADSFESKSANSAFIGATLLGKASEVLVGGRFSLRNGKVVE
jgi:dihydroorotase